MKHDTVLLPNGATITGVPEGATDEQIKQEAIRMGIAIESDFPGAVQPAQEQPAQPEKPVVKSIYEKFKYGLSGVSEPLMAMGSGTAAEVVGGLSTLAPALMGDTDQAEANLNMVKEAMTYQPRGEGGQDVMRTMGDAINYQLPYADMSVAQMAEGAAEEFGQSGASTFETLGLDPATGYAAGKTLPAAIASRFGITPAKSALTNLSKINPAEVANTTGAALAKLTPDVIKNELDIISNTPAVKRLTDQSPAKQDIVNRINAGKTDNDLAGYKVVNGKALVDQTATETIKQGLSEGFVQSAKNATKKDIENLKLMTTIRKKGKENSSYQTKFRPTDVVGKTVLDRYNFIKRESKKAANKLDDVVKYIDVEQVPIAPSINQFINDLDGMGIKVDASFKPDFEGSRFQGQSGSKSAIKNALLRLKSIKDNPNAQQMHEIKKFIDNIVDFGTSKKGEVGRAEGVLKSLRANIDNSLDNNIPAYNSANTIYAETVGAMNQLRDIMGKKITPEMPGANSAIGTRLEGINSNNVNRVPIRNMVKELTDVANKYGGNFYDDIPMQINMAKELDDIWGSVSGTSFQGRLEAAGNAMAGNLYPAIREGGKAAAQKMRGVNQKNAYKAIMKFLNEQN